MERNRGINQQECRKIAEFIENQTTKLRKSKEFDERAFDVLVMILESCCKLAGVDLNSFSTTILYAVDLIQIMKKASLEIAQLHRIYEERIPSMTKYLAELVSIEPSLPHVRISIFRNWVTMLRYTTTSVRKLIVLENMNFMKQLLHAVFTTGHYNTQTNGFEIFLKYLAACKGHIIEILEQIIPPDTDSFIKTMIQNFDYRRFDIGTRKLLNYYNMKVCSGHVPVYSVIANKGQLGSKEIVRPKEENVHEDLWLDFNSQTNTIGFFCDSSTFGERYSFWIYVDLHITEIIFDTNTNILKIIIDMENTTCDPARHKQIFLSAKEAVFELNSGYVNKKLCSVILIMNQEAKRKTPFKVEMKFENENENLDAMEIRGAHNHQLTPKRNTIKLERTRSDERSGCSPSSKESEDSRRHICTQINKQLSQLNLNENLRNQEIKREPSNKRKSADRQIPSIPIKRSPDTMLPRHESQKNTDLNFLQDVKPNIQQIKQPTNNEAKLLNNFRQTPSNKCEGKTVKNAVNDQLCDKLWKKRKLFTARSFIGTPNSNDTQIQRRKYLEERRKKEADIRPELLDLVSPASNPRGDIIVDREERVDHFKKPSKKKIAEENKRKLSLLKKKTTPPHFKDPFCHVKQCCVKKRENQKHPLSSNEEQNFNAGECASDPSTEIFELVDDEPPKNIALSQINIPPSQYSLRRRELPQPSPPKNEDLHKFMYNSLGDENFDVVGPSRNKPSGNRAQELKKVLGTDSQKDEIVISESEASSIAEDANERVSTPKNLNGSLENSRNCFDKSKNLRKFEETVEQKPQQQKQQQQQQQGQQQHQPHQQQQQQQQMDLTSEVTDRAWVMKHFFDCLKDKNEEAAGAVPREVPAGQNADIEVISVQGTEDAVDDEIDLIIQKSGFPSLIKDSQASQFRQLLAKFKILMDPKFEKIIENLKTDSPLQDMTEFAKELGNFLESYDQTHKKATDSYGKIKKLWEQISRERTTFLKAVKQSDENFSNIFSRLNSLLSSVKNYHSRSDQVYEDSIQKVTDEGKSTLVIMWKEILGNMAHEAHDSIVKHLNDDFFNFKN